MRPGSAGSPIGSSPLARGTRRKRIRPCPLRRFIPARAGNTHTRIVGDDGKTVHPRSRGEHCNGVGVPRAVVGSSPLARGTRVGHHPLDRHHRFIPARAGNTRGNPPPPCRRSVHPRSRGEHGLASLGWWTGYGSSPLARGTLPITPRDGREHRFIPARAGNTGRRTHRRSRSAVHPRSRGEHVGAGTGLWAVAGSSPLARGTPRLHPQGFPAVRFIPARAGNTRRAC